MSKPLVTRTKHDGIVAVHKFYATSADWIFLIAIRAISKDTPINVTVLRTGETKTIPVDDLF